MPEGLKCNSTSFSQLKVNSNTIWQIVNRNPFNASWRVFALTSVSSACPLPSFYVLPLLPSVGCFATAAEPGGTELDVLLSALQLQRRLRLREWAGQCQQFKEQWKRKIKQHVFVSFIHLAMFFLQWFIVPTTGTSDQRESRSCSSHTKAVRLQREVFMKETPLSACKSLFNFLSNKTDDENNS